MMCKSCKRVQRWCALIAVLLLFPLVAAMFWIAGGVFFPLGLVLSDVCGSAENVLWKFAAGSTDALCESTLGGTWVGNGTCALTLPYAADTVHIDLDGIVLSLIQSCDANRTCSKSPTLTDLQFLFQVCQFVVVICNSVSCMTTVTTSTLLEVNVGCQCFMYVTRPSCGVPCPCWQRMPSRRFSSASPMLTKTCRL